jgi:hypothetical protein
MSGTILNVGTRDLLVGVGMVPLYSATTGSASDTRDRTSYAAHPVRHWLSSVNGLLLKSQQ